MQRIIGVTALSALVFAAAAYAQTYIGNSAANSWHGSSGGDFADGQGGQDALYGEGGGDDIYGAMGADTLWGGSANDKIYAGCQPGLSCVGGPGDNNRLFGEDGNDLIGTDNGHPDTISGGPGYDTCYVDPIDTLGIYGCEKTVENGVVVRWD